MHYNKFTGGDKLLDVNLLLSKAGVEEGMKIADLGCGSTGHFVFPASEMVGKKGVVYAVDILKTVLESVGRRAKVENITNVKIIWSNVEILGATKIESNSLDMVFLINTLYQSHKRLEIIKEGVRMLKSGGKLMIVEWKNISLPFGPPSEERVRMDMIKNVLPKIGLDVEEDFFAGQYHFGLICTKA
jgi:ubiquinone/menaquinone biosynthesis C-methylase UbiE